MKNYREDELFNLQKISYRDLFLGLKVGIVEAISDYENREFDESRIDVNEERCSTRMAYGEDGNLYPKIILDLNQRYSVLVTPFKIEMLVIDFNIKTFQNDKLTQALIKFMNSYFPNSDYEEKRQKYENNLKIMKKCSENMLFL